MINGIEFYREVSPSSRSYLTGRTGNALKTVNAALGRQTLGEPDVAEDVVIGYMEVAGLSLHGIADATESLTGNKRNCEVALKPEAASFEDEGEHIEGLQLHAGRRLLAKQYKIMGKALREVGIRPHLVVPDMQLAVVRFMPDVLAKLNTSQVEPISQTVAQDTGLVYLEGIQARPMDDGSGMHLRAVS